MPTMIVLQARAKRGKTSTFRELAKLINNDIAFKELKKEIINENGDFILVVSNDCDKKIAIISAGDNPILGTRLIKVQGEHSDIDILFCACRTKGKTVKIVEDFAQKNKFELFFTSTYQIVEKDEDKRKEKSKPLNEQRAKELFGLIQTEDIFKI